MPLPRSRPPATRRWLPLLLLLGAIVAPVRPAPAQQGDPLGPGADVRGRLTESSGTVAEGRRGERYTLRLPAGAGAVVRLTAEWFDTYLIAEGGGERLENDDHGGSVRESRLHIPADGAREWVVHVTSYDGGEVGDYRLQVASSEGDFGDEGGDGDAEAGSEEPRQSRRTTDPALQQRVMALLERADTAGAAGDRALERRLLQEVIDLQASEGLDGYFLQRAMQRLAEMLLAQGDTTAALPVMSERAEVAARLLAATDPSETLYHLDHARAAESFEAIGLLRLVREEHAAARDAYARAVEIREAMEEEYGRSLAEVVALHSVALEMAGDAGAAAEERGRARELASAQRSDGYTFGGFYHLAQQLRASGAETAWRRLTEVIRSEESSTAPAATLAGFAEDELRPGALRHQPGDVLDERTFPLRVASTSAAAASEAYTEVRVPLEQGSLVEIELGAELPRTSFVLTSPSGVALEGFRWGHLRVPESGEWVLVASKYPGDTDPGTVRVRTLSGAGFARAQRREEAVTLAREVVRDPFADRPYDDLRTALRIFEAALDSSDLDLWEALLRLGGRHMERQEYHLARPFLERAVEVASSGPGAESNAAGSAYSALADLLFQLGDYQAARPLYARALRIDETVQGARDVRITQSLQGMARVLAAEGEQEEATELLERVVEIREAAYGRENIETALAVRDLGVHLASLGERARARALLEEAVRLIEAGHSFDETRVRQSMYIINLAHAQEDLAALLLAEGDVVGAREMYGRALRIHEARTGPEDVEIARVLLGLGAAAARAGEHAEAHDRLTRALAIAERNLPNGHPDLATYLERLAGVLNARGRPEEARPLLLRALAIHDRHAREVLPTLASAEQRAFVGGTMAALTGRLLSGVDGLPLRESYPIFGGWKGILLQGLRRQVAIARLASDPAHAAEVARLQAARAAIAHNYQQAGRLDRGEWQARNDSLTAVKETLERELARVLPQGNDADPWTAAGAAGLAARLPAGAAFVDVYRHELTQPSAPATFRYVAVLSTPGSEPVQVELGDADALDALVARWRDAVTGAGAGTEQTAALREAVWAPVAAALPAGTRRVWVSPDAQLARVSWSVLAAPPSEASEADAPLLAEVASPRALAQILAGAGGAAGGGERGVLLVGGVDFSAGSGDGAASGWEPLPGTAREVRALAAIAAESRLPTRTLSGGEPTPATVAAELQRARYAHLATHGFFFRETEAAYQTRGFGLEITPNPEASAALVASRNPLAESGLALAGANRGPGGSLTAEELLGVDLSGLALLVLSACDTGRGTEITGQGVMGLRASVEAAGARALVMSLWKVPDASTALLMQRFYQGLWGQGLPPAAALRAAQVAVRSDPRYAAPQHWAAWVLSGEGW